MAETEQPKTVDWEAIEREYRAGQLSVSEIGRICGVSHTAINKRAKKLGWTRNLTERVREEVSARLVSDGVSETTARETVEAAAERVVQLVREHRKDISAGRLAVADLVAELREASASRAEIEDAIHDDTRDDKDGKRRAAMLRAVSLSSRSSVAANLAVALKNLVGIERRAFGLDGDEPADATGLAIEIVRYTDPQ